MTILVIDIGTTGLRAALVDENGTITGTYSCTGTKPNFLMQAAYFGKDAEMLDCLTPS